MSSRPSLLRRSRISQPNNPLLAHAHFLLEEYSKAESQSQVHLQSGLSSSNSNAIPSSSLASELPPVSAFLRKSNSLEEIIIWEPGNEECEIVEVDESDLASYLQQKDEASPTQQIILLNNNDSYQPDNIVQNYIIQIQSPPEEIKPPKLYTPPTKGRKRSKIQHAGAGLQQHGDEEIEIVGTPDAKRRRNTRVDLPCLEEGCEKIVHSVHDLRMHLQSDHSMTFQEEKILFKSQQEFNDWRSAYEEEQRMSFIYRGGTKKISAEKAIVYMICHRSGIYKPPSSDRKRKMKPQGSCKIGTQCTAGIKLIKHLKTGELDATICHTHYGHALNNTQHLRLTHLIKEIVLSKFNEGLSFGEVLQYVHHNPDHLDGLRLVDRRAIRNIYDQWRKQNGMKTGDSGGSFKKQDSNPCHTEEDENRLESPFEVEKNEEPKIELIEDKDSETFLVGSENKEGQEGKGRLNPLSSEPDLFAGIQNLKEEGMGKSDLVDCVVRKLLEHGGGDSSGGPSVLLYKKPGESSPQIGNESRSLSLDDLCLIVQTPMQRDLLDEFGRVVHLELVCGDELDLLGVVVVDEFLLGIPVAWMISNNTSDQIIQNFFRILKINSLCLSCDFLFVRKRSGLQRFWNRVFSRKPRVLYPQEDVFRELKICLRKHYEDIVRREKIFTILQKMVLTSQKSAFDEGLSMLKEEGGNSDFLSQFVSEWLDKSSRWAFYTRTQIHPRVEECFLKLRKFILFKGTKSLDRNLEGILKIGYDKCFQHQRNLLKGVIKIQNLVHQIHSKHNQSNQVGIDYWRIDTEDSSSWKVNDEFEVMDLRTICRCVMKCFDCGICIHAFNCSCGDPDLCVHIHAVQNQMRSNPGVGAAVGATDLEVCKDDEFPNQESPSDSQEEEKEDEEELIPVASQKKESKLEEPPGNIAVVPSKKQKQNPETKTQITVVTKLREISPPRRTSTRLQAKVKAEDPMEEEQSNTKTKKNKAVSSVFKGDPEMKHELKMKKEKDNVKNELLSIVHEVDRIHDQRVLAQVMKKVNELSLIVNKSE